MKQLLVKISSIIVAGMIMSGCITASHSVRPEDVSNKVWVLTSINDALPTDFPRVTIEFKPENTLQGRVNGQSQCNRYFGSYNIKKKTINFTPMGSTMIACPTPVIQEERDYLSWLEQINQMSIQNNSLMLQDAKKTLSLVYSLETANIKGKIESLSGGFPSGSQVIVRIQQQPSNNDRATIIGTESIQLKNAVLNPLRFTIKYAPQLIQANHSYTINVQVMNKGKVIYASSATPSIKFSTAPVNKAENKKNG